MSKGKIVDEVHQIRKASIQEIIDEMFGGSRYTFAVETDTNYDLIGHWFKDNKKISDGTVYRLEIALSLYPGYIDRMPPPTGMWVKRLKNSKEKININIIRDVLVRGVLKQKENQGVLGRWDVEKKKGDEFIEFASSKENTYGFKIHGEKIRPFAKHGDFIVANTKKIPKPGDDVVVYLKDRADLILAELRYIEGDDICLGSITGEEGVITIQKDTVDVIHCITSVVKRGNAYKIDDEVTIPHIDSKKERRRSETIPDLDDLG